MSANKSSTENSYKDIATCFAVMLILPFLTVYSYFVNGFVLSKLWSWFIVTTFGLDPLNIVQAIGLTIVVGFLTVRTNWNTDKDKTTAEKISQFVIALVAPFVTLLVGWIVYSTWFIK
jgi:hypothetical protein